MKGSDKVSIDS